MMSVWKTLFEIHVMPHLENEKGQGMIEYSLLAALISIAAIAVLVLIGPKLITTFTNVSNHL